MSPRLCQERTLRSPGGGRQLRLGPEHPLLMGILNLTPDSFSDGGRFDSVEQAVAEALRMVDDGADILDLGAESSRPGAVAVPLEEELARLLPVVSELRKRSDVPISIDTTKASVARAALELGADWINDISALKADPEMAGLAASTGAPLVLMHMQGEPRSMQEDPRYEDCLGEVIADLEAQADLAIAAGVDRDQILVDPGIGFGKTATHNLELLHGLPRLAELGYPILLGVSRKSLLATLLQTGQRRTGSHASPEDRDIATLALTAWAHDKGVSVHRVHHVRYARQVLDVLSGVSIGSKG